MTKPNKVNHSLMNFSPMLAGPAANESQLDKFLTKKNCPIIADVKYDGERTIITYNKEYGLQMTSRNSKSQNNRYQKVYQKILE